MRLVVTTVIREAPLERHGMVYVVDWDKKEILHRFQPPPPRVSFDIPRGGNRGFRGVTFIGGICYIANHDSIFCYDRAWNLVDTISHPFFDSVHEIEADGDTIWVTSTGVDAVFRVDLAGKIIEEHFLGELPDELRSQLGIRERLIDRTLDYREIEPVTSSHVAHPNGIAIVDGRPYVTLYRPGAIIALNPFEVIWRNDSSYGAHSGRIWNGGKSACFADSFRSEFVGVNLVTGKREFQVSVLRKSQRRMSLPGLIRKVAHFQLFAGLPTVFILKHAPPVVRGLLPTSRPGWTRGISVIAEDRMLGGSSSATISLIDMKAGRILERMQLENGNEHSIFCIAVDPRGA